MNDNKKENKDFHKTVCWNSNNSGHVQADCFKPKRKKDNCSGSFNDTYTGMVAMLQKEGPEENLALTAWHTPYVDSIETGHMVKENSIIPEGDLYISAAIWTAGFKFLKTTS